MLDNRTIEYKRLSPKYHDDVLIHLRNTFFADEPLNRATKLCQRGEGHPELEQVGDIPGVKRKITKTKNYSFSLILFTFFFFFFYSLFSTP